MKKTYAILTGLIVAAGMPFAYSADDKVKIKTGDEKVKVKGDAAEQLLAPDVVTQLKTGYRVPTEYRTHFRPVHVERIETLTPAPAGQTVRVYDSTAYYMDNDSWEIVRTVPIQTELGADVFIDGD